MDLQKFRLIRSDQQQGLFYGALGALAFSAYLLINRYVYLNYEVDTFKYVVTFLVAGGGFAALSLLAARTKKAFPIWHKNTTRVAVNGLVAGVAIALVVLGQRYTTAINASIIATGAVLSTALFSKFILKEVFSAAQWRWLVVMFVGLYFAIVGAQLINFNKGDLILMGGVAILGFTNTFSKVLMRKHTSDFVADVRLISSGLLFVLIGVIFWGHNFLVTSAGGWPILSGLGLWLTIKFFYAAISYLDANKAIVLTNSHIFFTAIIAVLFLAESYSWVKFAGSAVVLVSIYFITKK